MIHNRLMCVLIICCVFLNFAAPALAAGMLPSSYRNFTETQRLDTELTAIMESARTQAASTDFVMGQIYDLAAGLRYPLTVGDALAATLDVAVTLKSPKDQSETVLQMARVVLHEDVEGVRATLRSINDLKAEASANGTIAAYSPMLDKLATICNGVGYLLESLSGRCIPPRYTAPVRSKVMWFMNEQMAAQAQQTKNHFTDAIYTDRNFQNFLGGSIYQKINALRFPQMNTIRMSFFLERLHEATPNETLRTIAKQLALTVLGVNKSVLQQQLAHASAIRKNVLNIPIYDRMLQKAENCHTVTLAFINDTIIRYERPGYVAPPPLATP